MSRERGPARLMVARAEVSSCTVTEPSAGRCFLIQPMSRTPKALPVTM